MAGNVPCDSMGVCTICRGDDLGLGSLSLPSTQEQVTLAIRCSFSALQEGLAL